MINIFEINSETLVLENNFDISKNLNKNIKFEKEFKQNRVESLVA